MRKLRAKFDPRKEKVILDLKVWLEKTPKQEFLKNRPTDTFAVPDFMYKITQIPLSLLYNTEGCQRMSVSSSFMFDDKHKPSNFKHLTGTLIPAILADRLT